MDTQEIEQLKAETKEAAEQVKEGTKIAVESGLIAAVAERQAAVYAAYTKVGFTPHEALELMKLQGPVKL